MYIICWKVQKDIFIDHIFMFLCVSEVTLKCVCKMWIPFSYITLQYVITDHKAFYFLFLRLGGGGGVQQCNMMTGDNKSGSRRYEINIPSVLCRLKGYPIRKSAVHQRDEYQAYITNQQVRPSKFTKFSKVNIEYVTTLQNSAGLISNTSQLSQVTYK